MEGERMTIGGGREMWRKPREFGHGDGEKQSTMMTKTKKI
jgi:hypothetical protein